MRGHIRKRGNKWAVVLDLGRDPETGKRKQKWLSGFDTKKDAQQHLTEALGQVDRGTFISPSARTLGGFLAEWLGTVKPSLRPNSWDTYSRIVRLHIGPRIGHVKLANITPALLNTLYGELLQEGDSRKRLGGGLSPRTVQHVHIVLGRALKDAAKWGLIARNPARLASPPRFQARDMQVWAPEQVRAFLAASTDHPQHTAFLLAATTGMRRSEILGLRWQDVDLERGRLSVTQVVTASGGRRDTSPPKSKSSRRQVALDPGTVAALRAHRLRWFSISSELLFTEEDGTPIAPYSLSDRFQAAAKAAGLPLIRFHDLRHTHATLALQAGVNPKVVQERLGHRSISITLDTYSHVTEGMQVEAAEKVGKLITG